MTFSVSDESIVRLLDFSASNGAPMDARMPTLHLLCGKIAAGKTTLARRLAAGPLTVLISQDRWLSRLYPGELHSLEDYARRSACLQDAMGEHVTSLLRAGVSVVLDFPANTVRQRRWMRGIVEASGADHRLHVLDAPDEVCKARLRARNAEGSHEYAPTDDQFDEFTRHFVLPAPEEGFHVIAHPT
jgi:predicted kinase